MGKKKQVFLYFKFCLPFDSEIVFIVRYWHFLEKALGRSVLSLSEEPMLVKRAAQFF